MKRFSNDIHLNSVILHTFKSEEYGSFFQSKSTSLYCASLASFGIATAVSYCVALSAAFATVAS